MKKIAQVARHSYKRKSSTYEELVSPHPDTHAPRPADVVLPCGLEHMWRLRERGETQHRASVQSILHMFPGGIGLELQDEGRSGEVL